MANTVFEGTPIHFVLKWTLLDLPDGAPMPPIGVEIDDGTNYPHMKITFRVTRAYKGVAAGEVSLLTNLGGGDCGAQFATGMEYLIYLRSSGFETMCSPIEWVGSGRADAQLRYLRHEKPVAADLKVPDRHMPEADRKVYEARYNAATGVICGRIEGGSGVAVWALSAAGYSPSERWAGSFGLKPDGSFCSERLGPGSYYVLFQAHDPTFMTYYPGVATQKEAKPVVIGPGQTRTDIAFKPVRHETYSLRGFISAKNGGLERVAIFLVNIDTGEWFNGGARRTVRNLPFYYSVGNLSPGHYVVWIGESPATTGDWVGHVARVDLTAHSQFRILTLTRK